MAVKTLLVASLLASSAAAAEPVVLLHGFASHADIWRGSEVVLREAGFAPGPALWAPTEGMRSPQVAVRVLLPAIEAALSEKGYGPEARFHVVSHSMGGLLMRFLLEHPQADVDTPWPGGGWTGDRRPDGDPGLAQRVLSLVMISTPNRGARTGAAAAACASFPNRAWRRLACDLAPDSPFVDYLGSEAPAAFADRYLAIGVSTAAPMMLLPLLDADGDGTPRAHDNAVYADAVQLDGAAFALWRGWTQSDHFRVTCSEQVNRWIVGWLRERIVPPIGPRVRSSDVCKGVSKSAWRKANPDPQDQD